MAVAITRSAKSSPSSRSSDCWCPLVAASHELEEEVRPLLVDREVADLVDDDQPGHGVELELLAEPAFYDGLGQRPDHGRGRREEDSVAALDGLESEALTLKSSGVATPERGGSPPSAACRQLADFYRGL